MREDDSTYLVSTYYEGRNLANDPRLSNDTSHRPPGHARPGQPAEETGLPPGFIFSDPPVHDRLRDTINRPFGPPHSPRFLDDLRGDLANVVTELLDAFEGKDQVDIAEDFAYPLTVTAICNVHGVPRACGDRRPHTLSAAEAFTSALEDQVDASLPRTWSDHPASEVLVSARTESCGAIRGTLRRTARRLALIIGPSGECQG
ncbi:cytochrome P450 [Streptomyces formicae]|uniref:Cytochrome P450 hydroxylase n=1 Tax=Streptomyces formicae TaxID=1616117 RepID=A0ABY3WLN0_9ACTN|nr:cytochrome P450 [Streptomyces formicae]UNM13045.1 hypothetical protein J4032_17410 [Streptomyces formicae]